MAITYISTLEEFKAEVKRQFSESMTYLSPDEVDKYFESEEVNREITQGFNRGMRRLDDGEITQQVFAVGCTSAVCNCLEYMYE